MTKVRLLKKVDKKIEERLQRRDKKKAESAEKSDKRIKNLEKKCQKAYKDWRKTPKRDETFDEKKVAKTHKKSKQKVAKEGN